MKKSCILLTLVLFMLCLSSCDALLEEATSDTGTVTEIPDTVGEINTAPDTVTEEPTAKPTEPSTEDTTEEPTEASTEAVTYEDEVVNALVNELRAKGYDADMERTLHEETASNGLDFSYSISTGSRILSPGDTLEVTVNEIYYYNKLQDVKAYCLEELQYDQYKTPSERLEFRRKVLGDYDLFNISAEQGLIMTSEDFIHWSVTIPADCELGYYMLTLRLYDDLITFCCFIVH